MKKLVCLILALCMSISLVACGQSNTSPSGNSSASDGSTAGNTASTGDYQWPTRPVNVTVAASAGGGTDCQRQ